MVARVRVAVRKWCEEKFMCDLVDSMAPSHLALLELRGIWGVVSGVK